MADGWKLPNNRITISSRIELPNPQTNLSNNRPDGNLHSGRFLNYVDSIGNPTPFRLAGILIFCALVLLA